MIGEVEAVGKPDPKGGKRPIAFITLKVKATKEKIIDHIFKFV